MIKYFLEDLVENMNLYIVLINSVLRKSFQLLIEE
jgi:hypothetical protein